VGGLTAFAGFTVFYDANVLYPAELRSLLMHLAPIEDCLVRSGRRTFQPLPEAFQSVQLL
jgi:hypothetical protein